MSKSLLFGQTGKPTEDNDEITLESAALIMEAVLLENLTPDEMNAFITDHNEVNAAYQDEVLLEKSVVRLDRQARLSQAQKVATFSIAKERNDPMFKKLLTVWRMERYLEALLYKKYGNQAMRVARQTVSKASASRSSVVKRAASNVHKQLNMDNANKTIHRDKSAASQMLSRIN
jgi:hypothetical protein